MNEFKVTSGDLAKFSLLGVRLNSGKIRMYSNNRIIDNWPKTIDFMGYIWHLQTINIGSYCEGGTLETANYK